MTTGETKKDLTLKIKEKTKELHQADLEDFLTIIEFNRYKYAKKIRLQKRKPKNKNMCNY